MKTYALFPALVLLTAGIIFPACTDSETAEDLGVSPVSPSPEVSGFFSAYLPLSSGACNETDFAFDDSPDLKNEVILIDSPDEFKAVAPPSAELPSVDFSKYSLVIGWNLFGYPAYVLERQGMAVGPETLTLNLEFRSLGGASPAVVTRYYFWGLYEKLPDKPVGLSVSTVSAQGSDTV